MSVHVDAQRRRERLGLVQTANGNVDDIGVASVAAGYVGTAGRAEISRAVSRRCECSWGAGNILELGDRYHQPSDMGCRMNMSAHRAVADYRRIDAVGDNVANSLAEAAGVP